MFQLVLLFLFIFGIGHFVIKYLPSDPFFPTARAYSYLTWGTYSPEVTLKQSIRKIYRHWLLSSKSVQLTKTTELDMVFHADTGKNCLLVKDKSYLYDFKEQISTVSVMGDLTAKSLGYRKLIYYFKSIGLSKIFYFPKAYYLLSNYVNTYLFLAMKR